MGSSSQTCFFCHRNRQLIIPLLLFLISSLTLMKSIAEGRANNKLLLEVEEATQVEEEKVMVRRSVMIGSRPPSCERKCNSCVHCEAVQVPVTTKAAITNKNRSAHFSSAAAAGIANLAYSRGDDITNYKPMSWKCKCGNFFFNP